MRPSRYEARALDEIKAWRNPRSTWFRRTMKVLNWPLDKAGTAILKTPGVGTAISKAVEGLVRLTNEAAQLSVRPDAIVAEYREKGHRGVRGLADVTTLDLEHVDRTIGWLAGKYNGLAAVEGAGFGLLGLPGIPPDIVSLVTLNLRAIGEYATYCGFDVSLQSERMFAMHVLSFASEPSDSSKAAAMAQLGKIAREVAGKKTWKDLEKHAFVQVIQRIAKTLGIRLTKAKLAQVVPAVGAAVGGGFNAHFTSGVCDAAYMLYRERFLMAKYGAAQ